MIIANFVNYLLNVNMKTKDSDGIIYPSVPAQGNGFNVAIKPNVADTKIRFVGASLCHLLKQRDKSYVAIMKDAHFLTLTMIHPIHLRACATPSIRGLRAAC